MASGSEVFHGSPLKAPAIEVVDLTSEELTVDAKRQDSRDESPDPEADGDDSQWSLYEDALEGLGDEAFQEGGLSVQL